MLDVQRERLRHMLANAILELWKKETGSLSPVVIEGTICITAGSGRTTVVQVSNHFSGAIPDGVDDNGPTYLTPKRKMLSNRNPYSYGPTRDVFGSPPTIPPFFHDLSPASVVSPHSASPLVKGPHMFNTPTIVRASRKSNVSEQSMDISNIKEETLSDNEDNNQEGDDDDEEDKELVVNVSHDSSAGAVFPGLCVQDGKDADADESKDTEIDVTSHEPTEAELTQAFDTGPLMSTPKPRKGGTSTTAEGDALDLSSRRKEDDLVLSPPQNYTAQVRNVIRQRLLATRQHSTDSPKEAAAAASSSSLESSGENSNDRNDSSSTSHAIVGMSPHLPPLMNLNLNSPSMLSLQYNHLMHRPKLMAPPAPIHDLLSVPGHPTPSPPIISPEAYSPRPPSQGSFDQNGNNKDYINDKGEPQKVYRCSFCSKTFLFKSKYYEHLPVHTNVRPFQCHLCSRTYKYKYDLRVHLRTHMGIPTKSTVCPFCSVKFDTNKMLRLHIQDYHRGCVLSDQNVMSPTDAPVPAEARDRLEEVSASS